MITAGDFRNGMTFEEDGNVMQVVEFQHVKPAVTTTISSILTPYFPGI